MFLGTDIYPGGHPQCGARQSNQGITFADITAAASAFKGTAFNPTAGCPDFTCGTSIHPDNPYYFTGRRLDLHVRDEDGSITGHVGEPLLTLYHYRAREYDARHGRFLQRDPAGYVDGMNLYEYVGSNPVSRVDPTGKWGQPVHEDLTIEWATDSDMSPKMRQEAAELVGRLNIETDGGLIDGGGTGFTSSYLGGDQSRHFNRNPPGWGGDTRLEWAQSELLRARQSCSKGRGKARKAAGHLARALHSVQDWWAHGEYSSGRGDLGLIGAHGSRYDVWGEDAVGEFHGVRALPNGRAPQVIVPVLSTTTTFNFPSGFYTEVRWENWAPGPKRQRGTEDDTKQRIEDFLGFLETGGDLECRCFFLGRP